MSEIVRTDESEPPRTSSPNNPAWWRRNLLVLGLGAVIVVLAVALTVVLIPAGSSSARVDTSAAQTSDSISAGPESDVGVPDSASPSSSWAAAPSTDAAWTPDAGTAGTDGTDGTDGTTALSITDSGFTYIPDGNFVTWGAELTNAGPDLTSVDVSATALDRNGNALDSDSVSLGRVASGKTYVGGIFIHASDAVSSVQVTIGNPGKPYNQFNSPIDGTLTAKSRVLDTGLSGSLSVRFTSSMPFPVKSGSEVDVAFRNAQGNIIGGGHDFTKAAIPAGGSVSMALNDMLIPAGSASADVSVDVFFV